MNVEFGGGDFLVDDGSGAALVQTEHAFVALKPTKAAWTREPAARHRDFLLARQRPDPIFAISNEVERNLIYNETTLVAAEVVTICGFAQRSPERDSVHPAAGGPFRSVSTRCVISGSADRPVYVFQEEPLGQL